jgi:hypothetical protein
VLLKGLVSVTICLDFKKQQAAKLSTFNLGKYMRYLLIVISLLSLSACSTALAVADTVGTVVVYGAKTIVNTVDAITPDLVNKKKN